MNCGLPGSSVYGILQARILEWVAVPSCRGFSQPRDQTGSSALQVDSTAEPLEKLLGLTLAPVISLSISEIHSLENVLETTVWVSMLLATGEALLSGSLRRQNLEIQVYILTHIYNLAVSSQCTIFQNYFGQPFFFTQFHEIFSYICNSVKILLSWSTFHPGIHQLLG